MEDNIISFVDPYKYREQLPWRITETARALVDKYYCSVVTFGGYFCLASCAIQKSRLGASPIFLSYSALLFIYCCPLQSN